MQVWSSFVGPEVVVAEENNHNGRLRPLLATKLDPPIPVKGLVTRPEVVAQLVASPLRLTLVAAPAGWGKSTAIAEWSSAEIETRPFGFVRLGPEENDPAMFWAYVTASIGQVIGGSPDPAAQAAVLTPGTDPTRSVVPNLINRLHELDQPVVLVLDDYHTVTNPDVHRSVSYFVDNAPRCLHVVISTRSDPPLPLAGYRAAGTISEVRVEQLQMSSNETQRFLEQRFDIDLSVEEAGVVCDRTEGWPAGIQLAGLSLVGEPDRSAFLASFAGDDRNIADYLATEVLRRLPEPLRQFLLKTSMLDEFDADVCNYLLEAVDSAAILDQIERGNLFLVGLDSRGTWYRYHHLFRDWLRHEHRATSEPDAILLLHQRAARWMLANGFPERAVGHLIEAGDVDQAAQLMSDEAAAKPGGELVSIYRWIDDIPDEQIERHPALALARVAPAFAAGDREAALAWADTAEAALGNVKAEHRQHLSLGVDLSRALVAFLGGDLEEAVERCQAILVTTPAGRSTDAVYAQGFLGASLFAIRGPEAALPHLRQSAAGRRRFSIVDFGITAQLAAVYAELGDWEQAEATAIEALSLPNREGPQYPHNAAAHYALAQVHRHRGNSDQAIVEVEQGIALARDWVEPTYLGWGLFVMSELVTDPTRQRQLLAEATQQIVGSNGQQRLVHRIETAERRLARPRTTATPTGMTLDPLTPRELDVLRLMRGDLSIREIGSELHISHNTTKGYAKTIYQKLGVNSRQDAIDTGTASDLI